MDSLSSSERCRPRVEPTPEAMRMILGRVASALFAAPLCLWCWLERADTGWLISPMGIVHGICFKCAGGLREPTVAPWTRLPTVGPLTTEVGSPGGIRTRDLSLERAAS